MRFKENAKNQSCKKLKITTYYRKFKNSKWFSSNKNRAWCAKDVTGRQMMIVVTTAKVNNLWSTSDWNRLKLPHLFSTVLTAVISHLWIDQLHIAPTSNYLIIGPPHTEQVPLTLRRWRDPPHTDREVLNTTLKWIDPPPTEVGVFSILLSDLLPTEADKLCNSLQMLWGTPILPSNSQTNQHSQKLVSLAISNS